MIILDGIVRLGSKPVTNDLSGFDRFSETPPFCVSLESGFEAAF
jgi:hypothetical protein